MAASVPSIEKAAAGAKSGKALEFLRRSPTKLLIGGKWVPAKSGKTFESINPANEEVLALVAEGDKADIDEAVKAARKAFEDRQMVVDQLRISATRYLLKIAELIDQIRRRTRRNREPRQRQAGLPGARDRCRRRRWHLSLFRRMADQDLRRNQPFRSGSLFNYTLREPIGVCGLIVPWNFPLMMAVNKLAPALACGNTMVLKPAEQTPSFRAASRRTDPGSRHSRRRRQYRHRFRPRRRQFDCRSSRRRQGELHRLD